MASYTRLTESQMSGRLRDAGGRRQRAGVGAPAGGSDCPNQALNMQESIKLGGMDSATAQGGGNKLVQCSILSVSCLDPPTTS